MKSSDGMHYAPKGKPAPVVKPGEFVFAAVGLDHGHIGGMCNGLMEAGATLKWIYDPDPAKVEQYCKMYPQARAARSEAEVLEDPEVRLGLLGASLGLTPGLTLKLPVWAGSLGVLLAGVFVGMLASALEKILEVAPVLLRRFHIMDESAGIRWVMLVGKTVGALLGCLLYTL